MTNRINFYNSFSNNPAQEKNKDIRKAASEFESFFIYYLLKTMRKSVIKSGLFAESKGAEVYRFFLDHELSRSLAESGGIGLKEIILKEFKQR